MSTANLILGYVLLTLGGITAAGVYSELRRRSFESRAQPRPHLPLPQVRLRLYGRPGRRPFALLPVRPKQRRDPVLGPIPLTHSAPTPRVQSAREPFLFIPTGHLWAGFPTVSSLTPLRMNFHTVLERPPVYRPIFERIGGERNAS